MESYQRGPRFWAIDQRWGMAHIDLHSGSWQSWILNSPQLDPVRCAERAGLWPLAQILRFKGLCLVPAVSIAKDGFGMLIIAPTRIDTELTALAQAGWKLIGQRWTALREEEGKISLLRMPGRVERSVPPQRPGAPLISPGWTDLTAELPFTRQHHAFCQAVILASPGRRDRATLKPIRPADAVHA